MVSLTAILSLFLQLIILLLLNNEGTSMECGNHTYFSLHSCSCYSSSHVHCPGLFTASVTSESVPTHMSIQCHNEDPLTPDLAPLSEIRAVVISDCNFGNHSLLGHAENLTDLSIYCKPVFYSYHLNSILFKGLFNLKLLHVWCPGLHTVESNAFTYISKSLTHLTLRGSLKLRMLHENLFENTKQLVMIRIKDNPHLNKIPKNLFIHLKQLKSLYLDHNYLRKLHVNTFQGLEQLTDLSLAGNNLLILEPIINDDMDKEIDEPNLVLLEEFELARAHYHRAERNVSSIESNLTRFKRDTSLSLFHNLQFLTELKIDFNVLPVLKSMESLKELRKISLKNCSIIEINKSSLDGLINLESIDMSLNSIHEIPNGFLQNSAHTLQSFILTENIIPAGNLTLASNAFSNLDSLMELNLSRSGLRNIPFGSFSDLKSLKIIDLSHNYLNELPRLIFQFSSELEVINLSNNILTIIPNDLLENLENLKEFDISGNMLSRIPANLFTDTKTLKLFFCYNNKLRMLGAYNLVGLAQTHELDFSNNILATIDPETFSNMATAFRGTAKSLSSSTISIDLRNYTRSSPPRPMTPQKHIALELRNLSLANNKLTQLPARIFASLPSLKFLDLSNNSLNTLPSLTFLRDLRELWLSGNRLRDLPAPMFVDGSRLHFLSLRNNFITELPPSMLLGVGGTLTSLDVSHNSLAKLITPVLSGFQSLEVLDASHNKIKIVDFSGLTQLQHAELAHNALNFKEAGWVFYRTGGSARGLMGGGGQWGRQGTFTNCTRLQYLGMANNSISDVLLDLRRLSSLTRLDLQYNSVTTLEAKDLQYGSFNLTVDLRHNQISSVKLLEDDLLPAGGSSSNSKNVRVLIDQNPLSCDCRLPNLLRYLFGDSRLRLPTADMHAAQIVASELACNLPSSVRGKRIIEVESWGHYLLPLLGLCHVFH